jgi:hypothetical protein
MGLPWVRLDANIASHDKILALLSDPSPRKWQALASFMCSFAWSGGQGTDGHIPRYALPHVHGTKETARLLEKYGLWDEGRAGWDIRNFAARQPSTAATESARTAKQRASAKGNCIRHHGPDCGCWKESS